MVDEQELNQNANNGVGQLVDALGGPIAVAERLGLKAGTVRSWMFRSAIPTNHYFAFVKLAEASGVELPKGLFRPAVYFYPR